MSGDSSIISGCRPSATGTHSDSRPSSRWCSENIAKQPLPCSTKKQGDPCDIFSNALGNAGGGAVRHLLERPGKRGADAADPIDLSFPSALAPARSRVARRELPGPELRDPLNQADRHRLGQWESERPLAAFVWRQLLGERLDQRIACGIERVV